VKFLCLFEFDQSEYLVAAAVQIGDKVFTGGYHGAAYDDAVVAGLIDPSIDLSDYFNAHPEARGWTTSTGRYIPDGELAYQIAVNAKQVDPDRANWMQAKRLDAIAHGFDPDKPWVDSSYINDPTGRYKESYAPDETAPPAGEFVMAPDPSGYYPEIAVGWRQTHKELVADAIRSWKGSPNDMRIHLQMEKEGAPIPGSGSGKKMRMRAAALLYEVEKFGEPTPRLYRGAHALTIGLLPWSASPAIAKVFAKKSPKGQIYVLPSGQRGLNLSKYCSTQLDYEKEWIVDYGPNTPVMLATVN
jgi:hypothetical protein